MRRAHTAITTWMRLAREVMHIWTRSAHIQLVFIYMYARARTHTHTHTRMSSTEETCKVRTSAVETPLMHMTVSAPVREQIKV